MTDRNLMRQALDALEESKTTNDTMEFHDRKNKAITDLRERLARQSEREAFDTLPDDYETGDY